MRKHRMPSINFVGDREEVIRALKVFHYETAKVPETYLKNSGRELQNEYWEKLVNKVVMRMGSKMFLPVSVRSVITAVKIGEISVAWSTDDC